MASSSRSARLVLITGGAGGIGRAVGEELLRRGDRVVVVDLPGKQAPRGAESIEADLSCRRGVREATDRFLTSHPRLDVLINNVGAIFPQRRETEDWLESTFALNHLSYLATTLRLLGALRESDRPVVLNVSSSHYRAGRLRLDDLQFERRYDMNGAYCQSKLANQLFTFELARRLGGEGFGIASVHPGAVESGFGDPLRGVWGFLWRASRPLRRTPEAVAPEIVDLLDRPEIRERPGGYFVRGRRRGQRPHARDPEMAARLWEMSVELAGI